MVIACMVWRKRRGKYNHVGNADDVEGFEMNGDKQTLKEIDGQVAFDTIELMGDDDGVGSTETIMR